MHADSAGRMRDLSRNEKAVVPPSVNASWRISMRDHNVRYSGMWVKSHWLASLERWCLSPCSYGGRVPGIAADPFAGRHRHSTPVLPRTGVLCGSVDLMLCAVQAGAGSAFGLAACGQSTAWWRWGS